MIITTFSIGILLILLAAVVWLWSYSEQTRKATGLPKGKIIYTDSGTWFPNQNALYAEDIQLAGKPDYLVEQADGSIIPVEVKSGNAPSEPWGGHLYQLASYCYLVEATYGVRPEYGIIQYRDRAFAVDYTEELEDDLLDIIMEMRDAMAYPEVHRDHDEWRICAACSMRRHCEQRLDTD